MQIRMLGVDGPYAKELAVSEVKAIAKDIGFKVGKHDLEKFVFLSELPGGWTREFDPDGKVVYFNTATNRATHRHPCLYQYRALFAKLV